MIEFKNISLMYQNQTILKNLNLSIKQNKRVVITGASGSGKTTILKLIAGFIAPTKGEIYIDSKLVSKKEQIIVPPHKRNIGMIFQELALWPHMNVYENIEFGLKIKKIPKKLRLKEVEKFLSLIGLEGYNNKKIEQLSGGEQQRVALARAIIVSPKILLMDEPLSSLDNNLNTHLRREIIKIQKELKFTLVYVTHNTQEAQEIGDKIINIV
jgi:ABC-type Fe3+/spermidine/putrescine transport system ATPase subunit